MISIKKRIKTSKAYNFHMTPTCFEFSRNLSRMLCKLDFNVNSRDSRGVSGSLKLGGQVVMRQLWRRAAAAGGAFYSANRWGGNCPLAPPPVTPLFVIISTCNLYEHWWDRPERTKQMEPILRAKVKIFFKSENLKKCF